MSEYGAVDQAIARFDELAARQDRTPAARRASLRVKSRSRAHLGRRVATLGMVIAALIVATIGFAFVVGPIGIGGLFLVALATMCILVAFSAWPAAEKAVKPVTDQTPNAEVVRGLDSFLHRRRAALPAPAARQADAIADTLPLLESRLADLSPLDPLAQDARRLMGRHLPELIERYQRVPEPLRRERDAEGMTVDDRLTAGLDAARVALGDIGARLSQGDMDAFQTQGRFIESRYRDGGLQGD